MKLTIKNIGTIKEAEIKLSGLTVIAGENDSGKSTVGKLMFSIVKAISKYADELEENKKNNIRKIIENIYFSTRRTHNFNNDEVREMIHPRYFMDAIETTGEKAITDRIAYLKKNEIYGDVVNSFFEKLKQLINQKDDKKSSIERAFKKVIYSEFNNNISKNKTESSSVRITEKNNIILDIKFNKGELSEFNLKDDLCFNDSVIIETPMVLNFSESIRNSKSLFEPIDKQSRLHSMGRANIAFHIKDLDMKLRDSTYAKDSLYTPRGIDLYEKITEVIGGKIKFMRKDNEFAYFKDDEKHKIINVASGIKSFGMLQMLLSGGFLDERTLVILDEPEVHLHPNWQLKYAEIIVLLVKHGIDILVTTHSPYMLEALERYTEKYKVEANFYLAKDDVIKSENNNKTLSEIFNTLSQPFHIFDEMDAQKLQ